MPKTSALRLQFGVRLLASGLFCFSLGCGDSASGERSGDGPATEDAAGESREPSTPGGSSDDASAPGIRADAAVARPMSGTDAGGGRPRNDAAPLLSPRDGGAFPVTDSASAHPPAEAGALGGTDGGLSTSACDRACLTEFNTKYLEALVAHDATKLPASADVRFTENGKVLPLTQGLWSVAKSLRSYRQDFAEVPAGQTAGFVALDDDKGVALLAFRLKVVERKVTEIETTVCRQGQATFFAPSSLTMRDPIYDMEVDPSQRLPRAKLIEVVDLYFQALESGDGSKIPFDANASRNENGSVTASGSRISNVSMFSYIDKVERRYALVDEERGNVLPWVLFQIPMGLGGSRTLHLAELFKVSGGKIMKIQAIMVNQPLGTPSGWD